MVTASDAPCDRRRTVPPVASASGRSFSVVEATSRNSRGLGGPTFTRAVSPSLSKRHRPVSFASKRARHRPGSLCVSAISSRAPEGAVAITGADSSFNVWRSTVTSRPRASARSASSSRSGSFISQCARRRVRSTCGPPPSKPRAQSQIWSESSSATRPLPSCASTRSGLSRAPDMIELPLSTFASTCRNHSPQFGGSAFAPASPRVTGCFSPSLLTRALNACS